MNTDVHFVVPTYRLRDVGETIEEYDNHFWRNGHSFQMTVFDDPLACAPQAWAAGSVLMLLQACLRLEDPRTGPRGRALETAAPSRELRLERLEVGGSTVDLSFFRPSKDVAVEVTNRSGDVNVVVVK